MWQKFTERARKVVFYAQEEAQKFGEGYVSTEHLLLGLVRDSDSVAARTLEKLGVSLNRIRAEVEKQLPRGDARPSQDMTLTPRAKRVIDLAHDEARNLNNNYIGTEHLLLGLIREGDGLAGRVLAKLGVELERARREVRGIQGDDDLSLKPGFRLEEVLGIIARFTRMIAASNAEEFRSKVEEGSGVFSLKLTPDWKWMERWVLLKDQRLWHGFSTLQRGSELIALVTYREEVTERGVAHGFASLAELINTVLSQATVEQPFRGPSSYRTVINNRALTYRSKTTSEGTRYEITEGIYDGNGHLLFKGTFTYEIVCQLTG